ncbi:hypothetical protein [Paenibacillus sp. MBLB4367]|uniref:hypothetical protein n=1 Tax=Paenibacillus sp. MBLB4367 TaxID=3384767 RepID=UPI00390801BC
MEAAQVHQSTFFTDKPKAEVVAEWAKKHPDCTIENARLYGGTVIISYYKNSEMEAARLASLNKGGIRVGKMEGFRAE